MAKHTPQPRNLQDHQMRETYILIHKATGCSVKEVFKYPLHFNRGHYVVRTAYAHLCRVNRKIAAGSTFYNS
jgi:hypothetical protein